MDLHCLSHLLVHAVPKRGFGVSEFGFQGSGFMVLGRFRAELQGVGFMDTLQFGMT